MGVSSSHVLFLETSTTPGGCSEFESMLRFLGYAGRRLVGTLKGTNQERECV